MSLSALDREFQRALREMQRESVPMLQQQLTRLGYNYKGKLYNNIRIQLQQASDQSWELILNMPAYGKTLEKKKRFAYGASVKELSEWINSKGIENFYTPGYERSGAVPANAAHRIALAIQNSEKQYRAGIEPGRIGGGGKYKRRQKSVMFSWFYRPFFGMWAEKRNQITRIFLDIMSEDLVNQVASDYQQALQVMGKK